VLLFFDKLRGVNNHCNIVLKDFTAYETVIIYSTQWHIGQLLFGVLIIRAKIMGHFWDFATLLLLYGKKL
jgi:hypothetical protein